MESIALEIAAPIVGVFLGTLLFSRVGAWVVAIATAARASGANGASRSAVAVVTVLHSGPWLLAAVAYWAYHVLIQTHQRAWDWFFGAVAAAVPLWLVVALYLHYRAKRTNAVPPKEQNAA